MKHGLWAPTLEYWIQQVWGGNRETAFLTRSQVALMLLVRDCVLGSTAEDNGEPLGVSHQGSHMLGRKPGSKGRNGSEEEDSG